MVVNWVLVIGGFGLFFFSLRFLSNILERSISGSIRPFLYRLLATQTRCVATGFFATAFVQASSITIITTLGLLNSALINFEQGFLIMLGATLGTTVKSWIFAGSIQEYGPLIIGCSSILLLFIRNFLWREILEMVIAIGLAYLSLSMLSDGLRPLLENPVIKQIFQRYQADTLGSQLFTIALGCSFTMAIQSSSTVIFLVLELANENIISFPTGTAIILGTNIGTTITPLIASIEYGRNIKRLAFAHSFVKAVGVFLALIFFPSFLLLIDLCIPGKINQYTISVHLAGAHTLFNIINVLFWSAILPLPFKILHFLIPPRSKKEQNIGLSLVVRKMLIRNPKQALIESQRQVQHLQDLNKSLVDQNLSFLAEGKKHQDSKSTFLIRRRFNQAKEGLSDLLLQLMQNLQDKTQKHQATQKLAKLSQQSNFFQLLFHLREQIENGFLNHNYQIPEPLQQQFIEYQKNFNQNWLQMHLHQEIQTQATQNIIEQIQTQYLFAPSTLTNDERSWLYDILRQLEQIHHYLPQLGAPPK